ncbi:MAG: hypothetical protein M1834_002445 [Cirrosporium novae-zelandiae]|nr:MAG: hypothetical protein M1834_002445 [Cirrosporium novae-zelandiae]
MPESLKTSEVTSKTDPTVAKQYDTKTDMNEQIMDLYKTIDGVKVGLLTTLRKDIGPVSRSMTIAKRLGPDFLFIANAHSQKFEDLESDRTVQVTFQDNKSQDWVSVTGVATVASNADPRIKTLYNSGLKAWFGDLGDGIHNGGPEDPRMSLIEVKARYVVYWKSTVGTLGLMKEVGMASLTGQVAKTGVLRELGETDLEHARQMKGEKL